MSSSCKGLQDDLAACLRESPCVAAPPKGQGRDFHECLRASEEEITSQCNRIRYLYFECKRQQLDMRRRFRGNVGYSGPA
jgi:cytochrome c oxidase assembly factor 5